MKRPKKRKLKAALRQSLALIEELESQLQEAQATGSATRLALEKLVQLSSHYAKLLNQYDGGGRMTFKNADEWLARLAYLSQAEQELRQAASVLGHSAFVNEDGPHKD